MARSRPARPTREMPPRQTREVAIAKNKPLLAPRSSKKHTSPPYSKSVTVHVCRAMKDIKPFSKDDWMQMFAQYLCKYKESNEMTEGDRTRAHTEFVRLWDEKIISPFSGKRRSSIGSPAKKRQVIKKSTPHGKPGKNTLRFRFNHNSKGLAAMLETLKVAEAKLARKLQLALQNLPVAVREYPTPITSRAATPSSLHDPNLGVEDMDESEDESDDDSDEESDEDRDDQNDVSYEEMDISIDHFHDVNRQNTPTDADAEESSITDDDFDMRSDFALDLELREGLQNISPYSPTSSDEDADADMELVAPLPLQHYAGAGYSASGSGSSDHGQPNASLSYKEEVVNGDAQGVIRGWEQNIASGSGSTAGDLDPVSLGGGGIVDGGSGSQGSRGPSFYSSQGDDNASVRPGQGDMDLKDLKDRIKDLETEIEYLRAELDKKDAVLAQKAEQSQDAGQHDDLELALARQFLKIRDRMEQKLQNHENLKQHYNDLEEKHLKLREDHAALQSYRDALVAHMDAAVQLLSLRDNGAQHAPAQQPQVAFPWPAQEHNQQQPAHPVGAQQYPQQPVVPLFEQPQDFDFGFQGAGFDLLDFEGNGNAVENVWNQPPPVAQPQPRPTPLTADHWDRILSQPAQPATPDPLQLPVYGPPPPPIRALSRPILEL